MYKHQTEIRVRYGETDQMGYLYYGNYALYYEVGRVELMRSLGITYKALEEEYGIMLPVIQLEMRYLRPAYYDELIKVTTWLPKMPDKHILFQVELHNNKGKLLNAGRVKLAFVDKNTGKGIEAPDWIKALVDSAFGQFDL